MKIRAASLLLALIALMSAIASSQTLPVTQSVTANGVCVPIRAQGNSTVGIIVSGTWTGTFTPNLQISTVSGAPTIAKKVVPVDSTTAQATVTANGGFRADIAGFAVFNFCTTAWTSGTAIVTLDVSTPPAASTVASGGGGSGTVGNCTGAGNAFYSGAGTTIGCDLSIVDNGSGTVTLGTVAGNTGNVTFNGTTSGTVALTTPATGGALNLNGGLNLSGASGAATTIATTTANANLIVAPNGTGAAIFNLGTLTNPAIQATGSASNSGFYFPVTTSFCNDNVGTADGCLSSTGLEANASGTVGWPSSGGANGAKDTGLSRKAAAVMGIGNGTGGDTSGFLQQGGAVRTTAAFTTAANTSLQTITGLSWSLPATAANYTFHCAGFYSQATGVAAVSFGIQAVTNAPTNINAVGTMYTGPTAVIDGVLSGLTTTTATNIVSSTPAATGVNTTFYLDGVIENPALANSVVIMVSTGNSADLVTVGRGAACQLWVTAS